MADSVADSVDSEILMIDNLPYFITQINGQRLLKLRDEPMIQRPPKGTEIFVGRLPRFFDEQALIQLFVEIGPIYKLRLMVDFNGRNRGYAFITFFTLEAANAAILRYHNYEVRNGCKIGVYKSVDNCRLFVGNLPRSVTKWEIFEAFAPYAEGLNNVILYKSMEDPTKNRGFAFLEFNDHRAAAMTRRKLAPGTFIVWNCNILVDWADPLPEVDPKVMSTVKKLYMRNLDQAMTTDDLKQIIFGLLYQHTEHIVKVYKTKDYAFIHFSSRPAADMALAMIQANIVLFGEDIEVTWARPKIYSKACRVNTFTDTFCTSLPPQNRRIVHMRQQLAKMHNNKNLQQMVQYQQYPHVTNNRIPAMVAQGEKQPITFRSNL